MIIPVSDEWVGPISVAGAFFVQAHRGALRVWWGVATDPHEPNVVIVPADPPQNVDLNLLGGKLDGLKLHQGETRHFGHVPGQVIYLRASDGIAALASLGQWPSA